MEEEEEACFLAFATSSASAPTRMEKEEEEACFLAFAKASGKWFKDKN